MRAVQTTLHATLSAGSHWLFLLQVLACIGEQFDEGDEVCGVCVNIRSSKDRIELWSKTAANEALQVCAVTIEVSCLYLLYGHMADTCRQP